MGVIVFIGDSWVSSELIRRFEGGTWEIRKVGIEQLNELPRNSLVFECTEDSDPEKKREVVRAVLSILPDHSTLVSSVETSSPTRLGGEVKKGQRYLGFHLFRRDRMTSLVEVIVPEDGDQEAAKDVQSVLRNVGFHSVIVRDRPGYLSWRLLVPYLNQAAQVFDDGVATAEDIDKAVRLGLGYPIGPLALLDQMGLDRYLKIAGTLADQLPDAKYKPPAVLFQKVHANRTGRQTGKGFFQYPEEGESTGG